MIEVSDPSHYRYGDHLSFDDVNRLVQPDAESLDLVHKWLAEHGISELSYSYAKDWISVSLPLETVEQLLDTKYRIYEHEDGDRLVRTPEWSLPIHLHQH